MHVPMFGPLVSPTLLFWWVCPSIVRWISSILFGENVGKHGFLRALFPLFLLIESTFLDAFPPLDLFARVHHHVGLSEIRSQFHPVVNQTGDKSPIYQTQPYVMLLAEYIPFYPIIYTRLHPQIYPNYITMKSIPHLTSLSHISIAHPILFHSIPYILLITCENPGYPRLGFRTSARPRSFASLALAGWSARKGRATKGFPAAMVSLRPPKPQWVLGKNGMVRCTSCIHNVSYIHTYIYMCVCNYVHVYSLICIHTLYHNIMNSIHQCIMYDMGIVCVYNYVYTPQ